MISFDNIILVLSLMQPLLIGLAIVLGFGRQSSVSSLYRLLGGLRNKNLNSRLYECSTYSRLSNMFSYNLNTIKLLLSYLLYDVDLIFFLSETTVLLNYDSVDALVLFSFIVFFFIGLLYDFKKMGYSWSL